MYLRNNGGLTFAGQVVCSRLLSFVIKSPLCPFPYLNWLVNILENGFPFQNLSIALPCAFGILATERKSNITTLGIKYPIDTVIK